MSKEALQRIGEKLQQIEQLYAECEVIALASGVSFSYNGPAGYGDGGYFDPEDSDSIWMASSQSC